MSPSCADRTSQVQSVNATPQRRQSNEQPQKETNCDEPFAEDNDDEEEEEDEEDGEYCYDNETVEVKASGSNGAIAQIEQCSDVQLGARLHYHAPVVINQHFGSEHHEAHIPPTTKNEESGKDIYDLFAPSKDKQRSCNLRLWAYITGLFLANVVVTCIVAGAIIATSPENVTSDLEQRSRFNQFLEFIQSHTSGKAKWAALPTVVRANDLELARWMLQKGANTEAMDEDGWTAVHRAAESGLIPMLQLLAEYGADLRARNTFGDTTIHIAIAEGHADTVKWLLNDGGVPADIVSKAGATPLYNAIVYYFRPQVSRVFPEVLQVLLSNGADLSKISFGETALHLAAEKGYVAAVQGLLKAGADVNLVDVFGRTPLHRAALAGKLEVVKVLVQHGASMKALDIDGMTPIDIAKDDVAKWFKTLGYLSSVPTTTAVGTTLNFNEQRRTINNIGEANPPC